MMLRSAVYCGGHTATACRPAGGLRQSGLVHRRMLGGRVPLKPIAFKEDEREPTQKKPQADLEKAMKDTARDLKSDQPSNLPRPTDLKEACDLTGKTSSSFDAQVHVPFFVPAFTRRREVFIGRIAMLGFFGTCIAEVLTGGLGPLGQLRAEFGIAEPTAFSLVMLVIAYNILGGLGPWSPTWSPANMEDIRKRPSGPPRKWPLFNPYKLLGCSSWGFTKQNELFQGRLAMLGFLAALIGEVRTGGLGPIGQVFHSLDREPNLMMGAAVLLIWPVAATLLAFLNNNAGEVQGGEDIY